MNRLYATKPPGKFAVSSESVLALLLVAALFQIVLCCDAGSGLLPATGPIQPAVQVPTLATNAPSIGDNNSASRQKSPGFPFAINHG